MSVKDKTSDRSNRSEYKPLQYANIGLLGDRILFQKNYSIKGIPPFVSKPYPVLVDNKHSPYGPLNNRTSLMSVNKKELSNQTPAALTGRDLIAQMKQSGLVGMWEDRKDIKNSAKYARRLRGQASIRHKG